jgi:hypothetical protein
MSKRRHDEKKAEVCGDADSNPACPYVTQINQSLSDIREIKQALVGVDMQSGIVGSLKSLKASQDTQRSWNNVVKPITISVIAAIIVAVIVKFPWL